MKTQTKINNLEKELAELKLKLNSNNIIFIPELNIKVEKEIHHKVKSYNEMIKDMPKGMRLLRTDEIIFLFNSEKYNKLLNLKDTWEFIEQPFNLNKQNNYVAWLLAGPDVAGVGCDRLPGGACASLGVRWVIDEVKK